MTRGSTMTMETRWWLITARSSQIQPIPSRIPMGNTTISPRSPWIGFFGKILCLRFFRLIFGCNALLFNSWFFGFQIIPTHSNITSGTQEKHWKTPGAAHLLNLLLTSPHLSPHPPVDLVPLSAHMARIDGGTWVDTGMTTSNHHYHSCNMGQTWNPYQTIKAISFIQNGSIMLYMYIYICIYVCVYIYTYIYVYIYMYT